MSIFLPPIQKIDLPLHPTRFDAQMAESVDALVSNTNGVTPVPVRPRLWVRKTKRKALKLNEFWRLFYILLEHCWNIFVSDIVLNHIIPSTHNHQNKGKDIKHRDCLMQKICFQN